MKQIKSFKDWKIQQKLGLISAIFALLAVVNYLSLDYCKGLQKRDAPLVDAAGRNRMLSQRIGFFAERIAKGEEAVRQDLEQAIMLHDTSLNALKFGGVAPGITNDRVLPPAPAIILPTLLEAEALWIDYKQHAKTIAASPLQIDTVRLVEVFDTAGVMTTVREPVQRPNPRIASALVFIEENATPLLAKNNALVKDYVRYNEAKQEATSNALLVLLFLNLVLIGLAFYVIRKYIIRPAEVIQQITQRMAQGDLSVRSDYNTQDELGTAVRNTSTLAQNLQGVALFAQSIGQGTFNTDFQAASDSDTLGIALLQMSEQLLSVARKEEKRKWTSEGLTYFDDILRNNQKDLTSLSQHLLSSLVKHIDANQGAIYMRGGEDSEPYLELIATYAWGRVKHQQDRLNPGEGLVGQAWLEEEMTYLAEVPEDFIKITSGLGRATPRCLLIVPLKANEEVVGVLEIASFKEYEDYRRNFVAKLGENIAAVFLAAKVSQTTRLLLEETQQQAEEMRAAEEEMRQNMEELAATQEEMDRKEQEYQRVIAELQEAVAANQAATEG
ncbi:MAG: GAF domain-containing protein [Tunicatimonas sp.]